MRFTPDFLDEIRARMRRTPAGVFMTKNTADYKQDMGRIIGIADRVGYNYRDASKLIGVSVNHLRHLVQSKKIRVSRLGCRVIIPRSELLRVVEAEAS